MDKITYPSMYSKLKANKAKCLICGDVIESKTIHDFVTCTCGNLSVDGGKEYCKRSVMEIEKYEELSEYSTVD